MTHQPVGTEDSFVARAIFPSNPIMAPRLAGIKLYRLSLRSSGAVGSVVSTPSHTIRMDLPVTKGGDDCGPECAHVCVEPSMCVVVARCAWLQHYMHSLTLCNTNIRT